MTMQANQHETTEESVATVRNGVDVDRLVGTIEAVRGDPDIATFRFRSRSAWIDGGHVRTEFQGFYGAKGEDTSRSEPIVVEGDEPPILLGESRGANAVEAVLHALAACLSVGFIYNAAARGITVESLEFHIEGQLDLQAFLGLSDAKRPGFESIEVRYTVAADAPKLQLIELCEYVKETSPVLDILRNPVPVNVTMVGYERI